MQQEKGSNPLSIYTASEYDIMEERHGVMQAIAALVPNHDERVQSIQVWPVDFLISLSLNFFQAIPLYGLSVSRLSMSFLFLFSNSIMCPDHQ